MKLVKHITNVILMIFPLVYLALLALFNYDSKAISPLALLHPNEYNQYIFPVSVVLIILMIGKEFMLTLKHRLIINLILAIVAFIFAYQR